MLDALSTSTWPFILAVIAAGGGFVFGLKKDEETGEPDSLVSTILYVIAAGCVIIGAATMWLSH